MMTDGMTWSGRTRRVIVAVVLCLAVIAPAWAQDDAPPATPPTVDEQTAQRHNRLQDQMDKGLDRAVKDWTRRYKLTDEQVESVRAAAKKQVEAFAKDNFDQLLDITERMQALRQSARSGQMRPEDMPADIRKDLAERALPLVDAIQKHMSELADDVMPTLDDAQRELLQADVKKMKWGLDMARYQVKTLGGIAATPPESVTGGSEGAPGAPGTSTVTFGGGNTESWDRYVKSFCDRYHLDEVQKVKAADLLAKYKAKAQELAAKPASQPASAPTSAPTSAPADRSIEGFRARLAAAQERAKPINDLFAQLKAELDKIPTPQQKQLAGVSASQPTPPSARGTPPPAVGGGGPGEPIAPAKGPSEGPR